MSCRWLTIQQFADYIQVNHSTVRQWIKRGAITHIRIEGVIRICECATDVFQEKAKTVRVSDECEVQDGAAGSEELQ